MNAAEAAIKQHAQDYNQRGVEVVTDTAAHTGSFVGFKVLVAATISAITAAQNSGNALTGFAIPVGTELRFPFTSITLTSGTIVCSKAI